MVDQTTHPPNCLASVDWIGKSAPAPLRSIMKKPKRKPREVLHLFRWFTHTPRSSGAFLEDASWSRMTVFSQEIQFEPRSAKHRAIRSDAFMCCHQQDHREFPGSLRGFEPKYLTKWPIEHSNWTKRHGPRSHHSGC